MTNKAVGINWTGVRDLKIVESMISKGCVDFVEILIDNFLSCDVHTILDVLKDKPCAFHIMNSRFLDSDTKILKSMSKSIKRLAQDLNPIYISDHLGKFYYQGFCLPQMLEIDYASDKNKVIEKLYIWQNLLDSQVLLENYPSVFSQKIDQADFFSEIIDITDCGLLFDISNAIVAKSNTGYDVSNWLDLVCKTKNFHIAGYAPCGISHEFLVDTHDCAVTDDGLKWANYLLSKRDNMPISVERDANFDEMEWISDVLKIRMAINDYR